MIPLVRLRTQGDVHANFVDPNKRNFEEELLLERLEALVGGKKQGFKSTRWKKAKPRLLAETGGKCAYCEAPTHEVAFGDVEHYRPKSVYWWLAYSYDNYLASCQLCNQKFKGARFPVKNAKMKAPTVRRNSNINTLKAKAGALGPNPLNPADIAAFDQRHEAERPLLLNPYVDAPEQFFAWSADGALREVELTPRTPRQADFVKAAEKNLGLNRPQLRRARYREFEKYRTFRLVLETVPNMPATTRQELRRTIEEMQAEDAPYAGMIRFFSAKPLNSL